MARVGLAAIDLDGTLLRDDATVSRRVTKAIASAQDAGITIVFVTARHWRSVQHIAEAAGVRGLAVCSNGALVYDLGTDRIAETFPIDSATARDFVDACRSTIAGVGMGWDTPEFGVRDAVFDGLCVPFVEAYASTVRVAEHIADDDRVIKLHVGHRAMRCDELLECIAALGEIGLHAWNSGGQFVDCTAANITKAHTLELVCAQLGIQPSDVVAIGDQPADLPMLRWAGRAVAMANAHSSLLDEIEEHAPSNQDDGVAHVLEALMSPRP